MADSRGMRNNNPLNIRRERRNRWQGMAATQTDRKFVQFSSLRMGYSAAFVLLRNYIQSGKDKSRKGSRHFDDTRNGKLFNRMYGMAEDLRRIIRKHA